MSTNKEKGLSSLLVRGSLTIMKKIESYLQRILFSGSLVFFSCSFWSAEISACGTASPACQAARQQGLANHQFGCHYVENHESGKQCIVCTAVMLECP